MSEYRQKGGAAKREEAGKVASIASADPPTSGQF